MLTQVYEQLDPNSATISITVIDHPLPQQWNGRKIAPFCNSSGFPYQAIAYSSLLICAGSLTLLFLGAVNALGNQNEENTNKLFCNLVFGGSALLSSGVFIGNYVIKSLKEKPEKFC